MADRHVHLSKNPPLCVECGAEQVQLVSFGPEAPARWRCRICKWGFKYEPPNDKLKALYAQGRALRT